MRRFTQGCLVLIMSMGAAPVPGVAGEADPSGESAAVCACLEDVRASIDRLATVVREQVSAAERREELDLTIAYLQYRSRRIESLEQDLRRLEDRRSSLDEQIGRLKGEIAAAEERLDDMASEEADGWRQQIARMRRAIESEEGAVDRLDTRIIDLENEILDGRRQLSSFEDFVLRNLELGD